MSKPICPLVKVAVCSILASGFSSACAENAAHITVPAGQLRTALDSVAAQTGVQFLYDQREIDSLRTEGVQNAPSLQAALEALLKGTTLQCRADESGAILIAPGKSLARFRTSQLQTSDAPAGTSSSDTAGLIDGAVLAEVIVSAQKREQRLSDVPVPVTALDANSLSRTNKVLLRDYVAEVPGFNVTPSYAATQTLALRGVTTGGLATPTVGVLVDDVPIGLSIGANGNNVPDIDPGDLARIEVLRGPQGTLYGANSLGGLVKFVTADPSTSGFSGQIQAGTSFVENGPHAGHELRASANIPLSSTLAMRASGFTWLNPGYIDNPALGIEGVNELRTEGGRLSALWNPRDDLSLKLSALYQHAELEGLDEVDLLPGLSGLQQRSIAGVGVNDKTYQAYSAILKVDLGAAELTSLTGFNSVSHYNSLDFSFAFGGLVNGAFGVDGAAYDSETTARKFTQELRLAIPFGERVEWLVGGFYTYERESGYFAVDAQDTQSGATVGRYWLNRNPAARFDERALFTDFTYHFTERFDVQVGGRFSSFNYRDDGIIQTGRYTADILLQAEPVTSDGLAAEDDVSTYLFTPRFQIGPDAMIYARFASGYRPGSPNSLLPSVPRQSQPDKTINYELGFKGELLERRLSYDLSVYYIEWQDIQIQLTDPTTRVVFNTNGAEAKSEGVELALSARPLTGLSVSGWFAYNNAELTEAFPANSPTYGQPGDRLPLSSRYSGNVSLEQEFPVTSEASVFIGGRVSYVGDRKGTFLGLNSAGQPVSRMDFPSYTQIDLRLGFRADDWTASVYANNLTDKRGLINGGPGYLFEPARIYIRPRTIGVNVVKGF